MATDKMSVQEFGAKIKAKYKEYKDLSDTDIGEKVLAKYPQYREHIRAATPADAAALRAEAAARFKPTGEMRAAPSGSVSIMDDFERDLRSGGSRTMVGRALGRLQGRGEKGYGGLEAGTSPGVADIMGSVPLGAARAARGGAEAIGGHPLQGSWDVLAGAVQAAQIPLSFAGGPIADAASAAIPRAAHAGQLFQLVEHGGQVLDASAPTGMRLLKGAAAVPVQLRRSGDAALRALELGQRGGTPAKPVVDLIERVTTASKKPLSYSEARDFYTNLTRLSSEQGAALSAPMKRQIALIAQALKADIGDAAAQVGQAANYHSAINEYAKAASLNRAAQEIGKWALRGAVGAAGVGAAAGLAKPIYSAATKLVGFKP